jgi:MFS transporter, PPP family, 3-phenylpropionic acid transporter
MIEKSCPPRRVELQLCGLYAAVFAINGAHLPFFPLWLAARGVEARDIATLVAVVPGLKILSTLLASRHGDRRGNYGVLIIAFSAAAAAVYASMAFASGFAPLFCCVMLLALAQGPVQVLADGVTLGEARRRRETGDPPLHYSFVRGWGSIAILASILLSGPIAAAIAGVHLIWLLCGVSAAAAAASALSLRGLPTASAPPRPATPEPLRRPVLVALVIASASLIVASHGFAFVYGSLHWKEQGLGEGFVSISWAAALVTEIAFFLGAGRWLGGERRAMAYLIAAGAGAVLRWVWMAFDPAPTGVLLAQTLHALSMAAAQLGPTYLLVELCGKERLAAAQGWFAAASSIGIGLVTFASGPLRESFGERGYYAMAALAGAGLLLAVAARQMARAPAIAAARGEAGAAG